MLVAVGMYLPFETTFAIFVGGVFRSVGDWMAERRGYNEAQRARVENAGVLTASRPDRRRSLARTGLGGVTIRAQMEGAEPSAPTLQQSVLTRRRPYCAGGARGASDPASDFGRGGSERTSASGRIRVNGFHCREHGSPREKSFPFAPLLLPRGLWLCHAGHGKHRIRSRAHRLRRTAKRS